MGLVKTETRLTPPYLTLEQAAKILCVCRNTVRKLVANGEVKCAIRVDNPRGWINKYWFLRSDLRDYLRNSGLPEAIASYGGMPHVLAVGTTMFWGARFKAEFDEGEGWRALLATDLFNAGVLAAKWEPVAAVFDAGAGTPAPEALGKLRELGCRFLAAAIEIGDDAGRWNNLDMDLVVRRGAADATPEAIAYEFKKRICWSFPHDQFNPRRGERIRRAIRGRYEDPGDGGAGRRRAKRRDRVADGDSVVAGI